MTILALRGLLALLAVVVAWEAWRVAVTILMRHAILSLRDEAWMRLHRAGEDLDAPDHLRLRHEANRAARMAHVVSNLSLLPIVVFAPLSGEAKVPAGRFAVDHEVLRNLLVVHLLLVAPVPAVILVARALARAVLQPTARGMARGSRLPIETITDAGLHLDQELVA